MKETNPRRWIHQCTTCSLARTLAMEVYLKCFPHKSFPFTTFLGRWSSKLLGQSSNLQTTAYILCRVTYFTEKLDHPNMIVFLLNKLNFSWPVWKNQPGDILLIVHPFSISTSFYYFSLAFGEISRNLSSSLLILERSSCFVFHNLCSENYSISRIYTNDRTSDSYISDFKKQVPP